MRVLAVLGALAVLLVPTQASAADLIGLSRDGSTWSSQLDEPLFDSAYRWVPGESQVQSFFVRNQAGNGASVRIAVTGGGSLDGDVRIEARADGRPWVALDDTRRLVSDRAVASDDSVRVDVRATFQASSTNQTMDRRVRLAFEVVLADARADFGGHGSGDGDGVGDGAGDGSGTCTSDRPGSTSTDVPVLGDPGDLPGTGAAARPWWLWTAAVLTGLGSALVAAGRHREEENHHVRS